MEGTFSKTDTSILDNMIVGRAEPYIYAFSTETVPNYLKVGDTSRGVSVRLDEWRKIFPNLIPHYQHSAQIDANTIFRDYAIHTYLEQEKYRVRLQPNTIKDLPYYSREFFKDATAEDVEAAINDIIKSARDNSGKYPLYSSVRLPQTFIYKRVDDFAPRENQQQAIDNFKTAVSCGRTNLLLYAVMRFGKSFTSMCCAKEIDARLVVIASAKADVKDEWKRTVESHKYFREFTFIDSGALSRNRDIIADTLADSNKKVALFLTLQDLQGATIKEKHKEIFTHVIDLLIIDETHFGVRGDSYGKVLQKQRLSKPEINKELKIIDKYETFDLVEDTAKILKSKIRLHLSGTPYRILMSEEFQKEDIIAFVQFTDIIDAQRQWDEEHLKEDDCDEWNNPYFGFPQMIRFAFNPNESSRKKMEVMRKENISYALSELLRPDSIIPRTGGSHRKFKHEAEILDLLEVIDGTKVDENLLGFLDYDKIKNGNMCRHIVCVLPFRASCDAMSALINREKKRFKNLGDYEIINIAGFDDEHKYRSTSDVKLRIKEFESEDKKTLTLTVNRMLTGTTVPQWDTMIYLKDTASPQEYDQAIFRLQNQYIKTYKDENGKTIKYNMKPQTLLVDFDPNRMFILQEQKSQFYNVNTEEHGNSQLKERIAKELEVSPIIILNKNKLQQATPTNITDAVREYARTRSIMDDASLIPADNDLLQDDTLAAILSTIEPIDSKNGLKINPSEGEGNEMETPLSDGSDSYKSDTDKDENLPLTPSLTGAHIEKATLEKRLAAYYARILFFAFLTESTVKSLKDIIAMIPVSEDNRRIARNLGLNLEILNLVQGKSNPFVLQKLDYKIENINDLMQDDNLSPFKRVEVAMKKFGRMSDSEIVTPMDVADDMVNQLPDNVFSYGPVLDIASKQGEFTIALLKRFGNQISDKVYSVCTSRLAYEFTRKVYRLLSLPSDHIFDSFTSYDLIKRDKNKEYTIPRALKDMNFSAVIGNPPYQENLDKGRSLAKQLFPSFIEFCIKYAPLYVTLITPSRWFTADAQDNSFPRLRSFASANNHFKVISTHNGKKLFPNTELSLVNYFLWEKNYIGNVDFVENLGSIQTTLTRPLFEDGLDIIIPLNNIVSIIHKIKIPDFVSLNTITTGRDAFGIVGKDFEKRSESKAFSGAVAIQCAHEQIRYISRNDIKKGIDILDSYKVFTSKGNGGAGLLTDGKPVAIIGKSFIGTPGMACTDSLIPFGKFSTLFEAENLQKYMRTKFLRFCVGILKVSQNLYQNVYSFVPLQDFTASSDIDWSKSVEDIDLQLYQKYGLNDDELSFIESIIKPM